MIVEFCYRPEIAYAFGRDADYLGLGPLEFTASPTMFRFDHEISWMVIRSAIYPDHENQVSLASQLEQSVFRLKRLRRLSAKDELKIIGKKFVSEISSAFKSRNSDGR